MPKKYLFVNFKLLSYVFQFVYYKSGLDKLMLINVTDRQINRQTDKQTDILFTEKKNHYTLIMLICHRNEKYICTRLHMIVN